MCVCIVTPCVGVWIETEVLDEVETEEEESHPAWVCGLKRGIYSFEKLISRHTLRGCVD